VVTLRPCPMSTPMVIRSKEHLKTRDLTAVGTFLSLIPTDRQSDRYCPGPIHPFDGSLIGLFLCAEERVL
jgi:hypothetical protein